MSEAQVRPKMRRETLRKLGMVVGAGALALVMGPRRVIEAACSRKPRLARYAMLVDLNRCIGCRSCTVACKAENQVPLGVFRTYVHYLEEGTYPETKRYFAPTFCNHCSEPPCVTACPVDPVKGVYKTSRGEEVEYERRATYTRPDGLVLMDYDRCIGCHMCVKACPYGARFVDPSRKAGGDPSNNTVGKCTYCVQRLDNGVVPSCVQTCLGGALIFGDLNDSSSEIAKKSRKAKVWKPKEGTKPNTYYVGLTHEAVLGEEVKS